jgi:hypothetical protein
MNSENQIAKTVRVISVIALMIGATGCATGGSKLDHDQLMSEIANSENTVEICTQYGGKMSCRLEDRDEARERFEYLQESLR